MKQTRPAAVWASGTNTGGPFHEPVLSRLTNSYRPGASVYDCHGLPVRRVPLGALEMLNSAVAHYGLVPSDGTSIVRFAVVSAPAGPS
jgi:hypothetical protein